MFAFLHPSGLEVWSTMFTFIFSALRVRHICVLQHLLSLGSCARLIKFSTTQNQVAFTHLFIQPKLTEHLLCAISTQYVPGPWNRKTSKTWSLLSTIIQEKGIISHFGCTRERVFEDTHGHSLMIKIGK